MFEGRLWGGNTHHRSWCLLEKHEIRRQFACSYTTQQNGVAGRKNRHLGETAWWMRRMRSRAECMMTEAHVINRLPQAKLGFLPPYQVFTRESRLFHISEYLGAFATSLCPTSWGQSWKRRRYGLSLLGTMSRRKGGDVLIPPPIKHRSRHILSLMRHHHGGLPRM